MRTFSLLIYAISKSRTVITLPSEYTTSIAKQWNLMPYYQCNQGRRNAWLYIIKESSLWKIENLGHNKNGGNLRVDLEFFSSEARWKLPGNKCQDPELFTKMKYRDNKIHGKKKKNQNHRMTPERAPVEVRLHINHQDFLWLSPLWTEKADCKLKWEKKEGWDYQIFTTISQCFKIHWHDTQSREEMSSKGKRQNKISYSFFRFSQPS